LHPFMPFITEEIWQSIPYTGESIMISDFPLEDSRFFNEEVEKEMSFLMDLITVIRNIRGEMNIAPSKKVSLIFRSLSKDKQKFVEKHSKSIELLTKAESMAFSLEKPEQAATGVCDDIEVFIPLGEVIDISEEKSRLLKEISKLDKELEFEGKKLQNANFLSRAPEHIIEKVKKTHEQLLEAKNKLLSALEKLEKLR
ncbi:class I tRNA ligase family protein, partial [bacterium]|nr:class I tRNA ligase family protein [bacterium]